MATSLPTCRAAATRRQTFGRREFIKTGALATAAFAIGGQGHLVIAGEIDVAKLTAASFQPLIGQPFKIGGSSEVFILESVDVRKPKRKVNLPPGIREAFSLMFVASEGTELPAEVQLVSNANFGSISIYVHQVKPMSTFSNGNLLGHTERVAGMLSRGLQLSTPKAYFEAPFN